LIEDTDELIVALKKIIGDGRPIFGDARSKNDGYEVLT